MASQSGLDPLGLLKVKVVKEGQTNFDNVRYLSKNAQNEYSLMTTHEYCYQVKSQLGLTGLQWCDFFSYIDDSTFVCLRIYYDREFFKMQRIRLMPFSLISICNLNNNIIVQIN